jgi:hypothetical protein
MRWVEDEIVDVRLHQRASGSLSARSNEFSKKTLGSDLSRGSFSVQKKGELWLD